MLFTLLIGASLYARDGTGIIELSTGILLLIPASAFIGAFLGVGLMRGAILSRLTVMGIESKGDGGQLLMLAMLVMVCCLLMLVLQKRQGADLYKKLIKQNR